MKELRKTILLVAAAVVVGLVGAVVPLGTYTSPDECRVSTPPNTVRLRLIVGDTLREVRDEAARPPLPSEGCRVGAKYTLYLY